MPEAKKKAVPSDFELVGQKKGFQRFSNPELKRLVAMLEEAQQQREIRLTAALQVRLSFKPEGSPIALLVVQLLHRFADATTHGATSLVPASGTPQCLLQRLRGSPAKPCGVSHLTVPGARLLQVLLQRFSERRAVWLAAVEAAAQLDALMSLAMAAASGDGDMCR